MAEYNAIMQVKQSGNYNKINLKSKSNIIDFDKTGTALTSTNVESAIKEVHNKSAQKSQVANTMEIVLNTTENNIPCGTKPVKELFQSVSSGKALVASAITGKGVPTASDATFQVMANNISSISTEPNILFDWVEWTAPSDGYATVIFSYTMACNSDYDQTARIYLQNSGLYWDFGWGGNSSSDAGWHDRGIETNGRWMARKGTKYYFTINHFFWSEGGYAKGNILNDKWKRTWVVSQR